MIKKRVLKKGAETGDISLYRKRKRCFNTNNEKGESMWERDKSIHWN